MDYINKIDVNGQLVPIKDTESGYATKDYVDTEIKQTLDYTAWEVYPTSRDLASGEFSDESAEFTNIETIPASMTEEFKVTIITDIKNSDVIVDWGDGNQSVIANGER